jgi:hypothetical protein
MSNRVVVAMVLGGLCVILGPAKVMLAAIESRDVLKTYFETGDTPTEADFASMVNDLVRKVDDSTLIGVRLDAVGQAAMLDIGETIGPGVNFGPAAGLGDEWLDDSGFLALSFLTAAGQRHYGYLQIEAGPDAANPYPMLVEYLVFEDIPDRSIETTEVPEPAAMGLLALGSLAVFRKRRKKQQ